MLPFGSEVERCLGSVAISGINVGSEGVITEQELQNFIETVLCCDVDRALARVLNGHVDFCPVVGVFGQGSDFVHISGGDGCVDWGLIYK